MKKRNLQFIGLISCLSNRIWSEISAGLPSVPAQNIVQNKLNTTET